jgi:GxxExxY protein
MKKEYVDSVLTRSIIAAFFAVYNALGYGFLESVYAAALEKELLKRGFKVVREMSVQIWYDGDVIAWQRLDMVVEDRIIIEIKSTAVLANSARRQVFNYLKATRLQVGLLLHFGEKPHVHRVFCAA